MTETKHLGNFILLFTAFIWGMAFAFQSKGADVLPPFTFTASRMSLAAVATIAVCIILDKRAGTGKEKKGSTYQKTTLKAGLFCGLAMLGGVIFQQIGIGYTTAGKAGFITALYILIVPLASTLILHKAPGLRIWVAVIAGLIGMYLLCMGSPEGINPGDIYVMLCALFFSVQIMLIDHFSGCADPVKIAAIEFTVISLICWIVAFIFEKPDPAAFKTALVPILYCGLISGGLGYTLQIVGQRYTDPTSASLCMSFEAVFAVVGGALLLGQHMSTRELVGAAIMFIAIVIVQLPDKK